MGTTGLVDQTPLTFIPDSREAPELELRVNFGMFAGRDATNAEIDDLARDLLGVLRRVSIVSLRRHEFDGEVEAAIHQVKVEASTSSSSRASRSSTPGRAGRSSTGTLSSPRSTRSPSRRSADTSRRRRYSRRAPP